jgi:hypothetical protein
LNTLHLVILIVFGEACKLWSFSLCSHLQSPAISSLLGLHIRSAPCSQTPSTYVLPLVWQSKFHTHTIQEVKYYRALTS